MGTVSEARNTAVLRGAEARPIGRKFWLVAGTILCAALAVIVVVSFVSAINGSARINRLRTHGVPVTVTVTNCDGNIGGSGSNAAGYTCRGTYRIHGVRYQEIIGSKATFSAPGSTVRAVADPDRPSTIELSSAVASSSPSPWAYGVPSILALLLAALAVVLFRRRTT
jgi:uncharacterized protein (TIGR03382 family)